MFSLFSIFEARTTRVSMVSRTIQTRSFQGMYAGNGMKDQPTDNTRAAENVESGGEPLQALGRGLRAAEETEALALQSLHARLQARDCVRFAGGAEALEKRVRDTRAKAVQAVRPWIELLADRRQCHEVRKAMEVLLKETKEEYNSTLSMKTAKAEVVQELQDRVGQQEWTVKQLQDAVESLEETHLCDALAPMDLESFFVDTMSQNIPEDLGLRAVNCLEALVRCGNAAARALESVGRSPASPGNSSELLATPSVEQSPEASNSHSTAQAIQIADVTLDLDPTLQEVASPSAEESAEAATVAASSASPAELNGPMRLAPLDMYAESSSDATSPASLELPMGELRSKADATDAV
eukprot:s1740_g12.t1